MKKAISVTLMVVCFLVVFCFRGYYKNLEANPQEPYTFVKYQDPIDKKFSLIKIPEHLDFAGETVPLYDLKIKQKFAEEYMANSYGAIPSILADPEKSRNYSSALAVLKEKHIPDDFIYLLIAESGLTNGVSQKGAAGIWQLMPESARGLGLEVDENVDERYDHIKSTYAACWYLKQAYEELGDWTLTAASYNMGLNGISRRIGGDSTKTYFDLYLNHETSRYIYRILAIKVMMSNPKKYGYYTTRNYAEAETRSIKVDSTINDLQHFAENLGYDIYILKKFNPWLMSNRLPKMEGKPYIIKLPLASNSIKVAERVPMIEAGDTTKVDEAEKLLLQTD